MTTVTIDVLPSGRISGFCSTGHAGFSETGTDIVCAGISAILQTAYLGLSKVAGLFVGLEIDDGEMTVVLERGLSESERHDADIILETMRQGLLSLSKAHPEYLTITERRCNECSK